MKKLTKILALVFAFILIIPTTACKLIIDGSVITEVVLTIDYYDVNDEVVATKKATLQLYKNNSPKTVKHVTSLVKSGFYNGTAITSVSPPNQRGYVQFGGFKYNENGALIENPYTKSPIEGEFLNNGWGNQKLTAGEAAIVLKRDMGVDAYDTGKGTLMIMLAGLTDISADEFCVIGKVKTTDGQNNVPKNTNNEIDGDIDYVDRSQLSSFGSFNHLLDLREDSNDIKTIFKTLFFNEKTNEYCLRVGTVEDTTTTYTYYKSTDLEKVIAMDNEILLNADEKKAFEDIVPVAIANASNEDEFYSWSIVPYRKVVVRKAKIK